MQRPNKKILLGRTDDGKPVHITYGQLYEHLHAIGGSNFGKSSFFAILMRAFIRDGAGFTLLDPHGELCERMVAWCARHDAHKIRKIHLVEPGAEGWRVGINPLAVPAGAELSKYRDDYLVDRVFAVMDAVAEAWGGEDINRMATYQRYFGALAFGLGAKNQTLYEMVDLLPAKRGALRKYIGEGITHPVFAPVFEDMNDHSAKEWRSEAMSSFNRIARFMRGRAVRETIGQRNSIIDFRRVMDQGEIVLINLAPKTPGFNVDDACMLGKIIINSMFLTALERKANVSCPHFLMIDECYDYLGKDISKILIQTRKFGLHLILAHHYLDQLKLVDESVYKGVLSGAHSKMILGGLEPEDAQVMADYLDNYDFETAIPSLIKPTAVGVRRTTFAHASEGKTSGLIVPGGTTAESDDGGIIITTPNAPTEQSSYMSSSGWSEANEPVFANLPTQIFSPEQLRLMGARTLRRQPQRYSTFQPPIGNSAAFRFKNVSRDYARPERVEQVKEEMRTLSDFTSIEADVEDEIVERARLFEAGFQEFLNPPEPEKAGFRQKRLARENDK